MFSKTIPVATITTAVLNRAEGYTADASLTVDEQIVNGVATTNNLSRVLYPRGIQIINTSGTNLEYIILSNSDEEAMYAAIGTYPYYSWILLPTNGTLLNSALPKCSKLIIRSVGAAGATSGIRIDFFMYVPN